MNVRKEVNTDRWLMLRQVHCRKVFSLRRQLIYTNEHCKEVNNSSKRSIRMEINNVGRSHPIVEVH